MSDHDQTGTEVESAFLHHLFPIRVDKVPSAIQQKLAEELASIRKIVLPLDSEPLFRPTVKEEK